MNSSVHIPVMKREVLEYLNAQDGGTFVDCTLGGGGHTRAILDANKEVRVIAFDRDMRAIDRASAWAGEYADRLKIVHAPFSTVKDFIDEPVDGLLADLGVSSDQLDEDRGFSFSDSDALDMRMDETSSLTAADIINESTDQQLYVILKEGGVGKEARALAKAIVNERPFENVGEFRKLVRDIVTARRYTKKVNPATVPFQAIRIAVNKEFDELKELLKSVPAMIRPGGRAAVITFHSLEDRVVGKQMRAWEGEHAPAVWGGADDSESLGKLLTKKAVTPTEEEINENPRSRSAGLRVFEFSK